MNSIGTASRPNTAQVTRVTACSNCGRDMNPGPRSHSTYWVDKDGKGQWSAPPGLCVICVLTTVPVAPPRGRRILRGSISKGSRKKARAYARRTRLQKKEMAPRARKAWQRQADRARGIALAAVERATKAA